MWKMVYRWLAKVSGGPTIEGFDKVYGYWAKGVDDRLFRGEQIAELNALLAESEAKVCELENNCQVYCGAIDELQAEQTISRDHITVLNQHLDYRRREIETLEEKLARWVTAHETLKQQRDAALDDLASIQQQTAKYVRP